MITPMAICAGTPSPLPPPLPSSPLLAADVEDDSDGDCEEEEDRRCGWAADRVVTEIGGRSSVGGDAGEDDTATAAEVLEDIKADGSEVGDTDVEDVEDAALEAL